MKLRDLFIITPKEDWFDDLLLLNEPDVRTRVLKAVPKKYRKQFDNLMGDEDFVHSIITGDVINIDYYTPIKDTKQIKFFKYRNRNCLLHVIRQTFYDTLLIVKQGAYPPNKYDYFHIAPGGEIVTEKEWLKK